MEIKGYAIVDRIDSLLVKSKIKRQALADNGGFRVENITKWKKRGSIPAADVILKAADFLGVSYRWLLTGQEAENELTSEQRELLQKYGQLDKRDKEDVMGNIEMKLKRYPLQM